MFSFQRQAIGLFIPGKDVRSESRIVLRRPAQQEGRLALSATHLIFDVARRTCKLCSRASTVSVDVAVEQEAAASTYAVEDRSIPNALALHVPFHAAENLCFTDRGFLHSGPLLTLLMPEHLTEIQAKSQEASLHSLFRSILGRRLP